MDWPAFMYSPHRWMLDLLRDELFAWTEFCVVDNQADAGLDIGWFIDSNPTNVWGPAADDRCGVARATVAASQTLTIAAGPPASAYGVTSGQRNPSLRIRWIPAAAGANLSSQRVGFITPAAADTSGGVYIRSTTTGNLFFVARNPTSGAETTVDLGVAPTTLTDYRIFTQDAGLTWLLKTNDVAVPTAVLSGSNVPGNTTRLLPQVRVVSGGGGSSIADFDTLFFRAWRGTPPVTRPDRMIAEDLERRIWKRPILAWTDANGIRSTVSTVSLDFGVGGFPTIGLDTSDPSALGGVVGPKYVAAGPVETTRLVVSPSQSPVMTGRGYFKDTPAGAEYNIFGFISARGTSTPNGAFIRQPAGAATCFFVTRQGAAETSTSLGSLNSAYSDIEIGTADGGTTWVCKINGVVVATHTTNVPTKTTALAWGAFTNSTTQQHQDRILVHCDRLL